MLNKFAESISKKHIVKVGILGNKDNRKEAGLSNATVGLAHEFGTFTGKKEKIPKRSFLRMPLTTKSQSILKYLDNNKTLKLVGEGNFRQVFKNLGIACEKVIQEAFETSGWGSWAPNTRMTVALKKSKKPLIDTAQLRRSITSKVEDVH